MPISDGCRTPQIRRARKLKALGLCVVCAKNKATRTVLCEDCRSKDRASRRAEQKSCIVCGSPTRAARKYCDEHRERPCLHCGTRFPFRERGVDAKFCSKKCKTDASRGLRGELAANWKGGRVAEKQLIRGRIEYLEWRLAVFCRDNWTCLDCGARSGNGKRVHLHAHHIKEFSQYPELRMVVSNGLTLCKSCHHKRHRKIGKDQNGRRLRDDTRHVLAN